MLSDDQFVSESINGNLYYLRSLTQFCINIELSFLGNNTIYIEKARDLVKRAEELGNILVSYASGNVTKEAIDYEIYVTEFTLPCELLTEKLFPIDINTELTEKELALTPGYGQNINPEIIRSVEEVNKKAEQIALEFINLCIEIQDKLRSNELFSYTYPSIYLTMIEDIGLYLENLRRLIARDPIDPLFAINYEYWFHIAMKNNAAVLRGLVNPGDYQTFVRAESFAYEYDALLNQYQTTTISPETQQELTQKSINITNRFRLFLKETIQNVLDAKVYFIVEPIFLDNMYTEANYFRYILEMSNQKSK